LKNFNNPSKKIFSSFPPSQFQQILWNLSIHISPKLLHVKHNAKRFYLGTIGVLPLKPFVWKYSEILFKDDELSWPIYSLNPIYYQGIFTGEKGKAGKWRRG